MVSESLVIEQINEGKRFLGKLDEGGIKVRAACWIKSAEGERWRLYVASPVMDESPGIEPYHRVLRVLRSLGPDWITSSDVELLGGGHPIVNDAIEVLRLFPHDSPVKSPRSVVGKIPAAEIYVYYPLDVVKVPIYHLIYSGAPSEHVGILTLDPEILKGRWISEGPDGGRYEGKAELDCIVAVPKDSKLRRNTNGSNVLTWNLGRQVIESGASEVWSFAKFGLHGFHFLNDDDSQNGSKSNPRASARSRT